MPFAFIEFPPRQLTTWVLHEFDLASEFEAAPKRMKKSDVGRFAKQLGLEEAQRGRESLRRLCALRW